MFAGDQLAVDRLRVTLTLPVFFTHIVLVAEVPAMVLPQSKLVIFWVQALLE